MSIPITTGCGKNKKNDWRGLSMSVNVVHEANIKPAAQRQIVSAAIASVLGFSLDLFDLFVLLYVAPVLGKLFFPASSPTLSLASVYASFAVTLLMRPIGSGLFGSFADRHGRKRAMIIAVTGVGIFTAMLAGFTDHPAGRGIRPDFISGFTCCSRCFCGWCSRFNAYDWYGIRTSEMERYPIWFHPCWSRVWFLGCIHSVYDLYSYFPRTCF